MTPEPPSEHPSDQPCDPAIDHPVVRAILVVEDDPDIRDSLRDALDSEGYQVITAPNGRDALDQLAAMEHPCLILLDLMMPVMGGGEFLSILRSTDGIAALPVVVVSAWPEEANQLAGQTQGFMKKPVALRGLLEMVARFCAPSGDRDGGSEPTGSPR